MKASRGRAWTAVLSAVTAALTLAACTLEQAPRKGEVSAFSNPTEITNPYLPFAERGRWVYEGTRNEAPYVIEVAVTPATRAIEWEGTSIETLVVRRRLLVDGLLLQEALVHYAQDDGGGVWSFGQDVANFNEGELVDHEGSRLAGADGVEPILVMPGKPKGGQAFSGEDVLGLDTVERQPRVDRPVGSVDPLV